MTRISLAAVSGSIGVTAFLAGSICAAAVTPAEVGRVPDEPAYSLIRTEQSLSGLSKAELVTVPTEDQFLAIALSLVQAQEPLGDDFERVLATNLEAFLD